MKGRWAVHYDALMQNMMAEQEKSGLSLGTLRLPRPFIQAPLSGYSDWAMRVLGRRFGAALTFSGVMLEKVVIYAHARRRSAFDIRDEEHPVGGQLLGNDPETMAQAAVAMQQSGYDLVDLNFACPAPKVTRRQRGGYLLNDPDRIIAIAQKVRDTYAGPLTMKLRIGWGEGSESRDGFRQVCHRAAALGIDALTIHGRTVLQRYHDRADWSIVAEIKRELPRMVIIGSGDLMTAQDAIRRMKETAIDGVFLARGAIGNPWIFADAAALWEGRPLPEPPSLSEQSAIIHEHFERVSSLYDRRKAVAYFRKFLIRYVKRHPQRKKAQMDLLAAQTPDALLQTLARWYS